MSRAERLLQLMETLRRHRFPVTGPALAAELGISIRSLYRDIAMLRSQGADIRGEPGLGYVLLPGFTLPPLMFSADEIEALVLGSRWVALRAADDRLGAAAGGALAKIKAVLPAGLREAADAATLVVGAGEVLVGVADLSVIRVAIRRERKLRITYRDGGGGVTERTIWPFLIGFFDRVRVVAGWCELRRDYRSFRADRIESIAPVEERYPRRRAAMVREWREKNAIPER